MSARDALHAEIDRLPEPVIREALHFVRLAARQLEEIESDDILPGREVEQEVLDIIDAP